MGGIQFREVKRQKEVVNLERAGAKWWLSVMNEIISVTILETMCLKEKEKLSGIETSWWGRGNPRKVMDKVEIVKELVLGHCIPETIS